MQPLQPWKRGKECLELFREPYVRDGPKTSNPPNVPQLHPVERFADSLKQAVYAGSWEASNIDQLKKIVHLEVKDIDVGPLQNAFRGVINEMIHAAKNELFKNLSLPPWQHKASVVRDGWRFGPLAFFSYFHELWLYCI